MSGFRLKLAGVALFFGIAAVGWWAGQAVGPLWIIESTSLQVVETDGKLAAITPDGEVPLDQIIAQADSDLWPLKGGRSSDNPPVETEFVVVETQEGATVEVLQLRAIRHFGIASLLPAFAAVLLCFLLREPIVALAGGVITGAMVLGIPDVAGGVLIPMIATPTGATVLVLYLWFLGGLLGIWSRTGAALAFASWITARFVRGPRSAKFVSWLLGVAFFQGGTLSTVLVGTTVKPVADRQRVSHEELSYIVDSTASPIAILLPFNAWPIYVQSLIFVAGVPLLATESDRIAFFFQNIPLYFYAWFAVLFTLLLSYDKLPFILPGFRKAIRRARETGELDGPNAEPLSAKELQDATPPAGYRAHFVEFLIPLGLVIGITVVTFFTLGSPKVLWGFGAAICAAFLIALLRGLSLREVIGGVTDGLKGVVYGSVVLLLAVVVGGVSRDVGAGPFLVELFGDHIAFWALPAVLVVVAMVIAFSTGTSWGTFAVALPLAMPLAWAVGSELSNPELFLGVCFAAVLNGAVFGDQCSPISDTTVLSSMSTGCDLMDHVRTQIFPCTVAMTAAIVLWIGLTLLAA